MMTRTVESLRWAAALALLATGLLACGGREREAGSRSRSEEAGRAQGGAGARVSEEAAAPGGGTQGMEEGAMSLTITSAAFEHQGEIPKHYTCDGEDISPPLSFANVPEEARSLALIVDDPDAPDPRAPRRIWVHWVLYNIPPAAAGLPEGVSSAGLPAGTMEGANDWGKTGYGGPCPPIGRHRYFHKLYALDTVLPDLKKPTKKQLEEALEGHVLDAAELVGTYQRPGR